jgi:hypothetical protein
MPSLLRTLALAVVATLSLSAGGCSYYHDYYHSQYPWLFGESEASQHMMAARAYDAAHPTVYKPFVYLDLDKERSVEQRRWQVTCLDSADHQWDWCTRHVNDEVAADHQ